MTDVLDRPMTLERLGPPLARLTHRLAETPSAFLDEPRIGGQGRVSVAALVNDLMARAGPRVELALLARFQGTSPAADRNRLKLTAIAVWLLADDWFAGQLLERGQLLTLLSDTAAAMAAGAAADRFASDPDRREELARTALAAFGFHPEGETPTQATDRLVAVSNAERQRLLNASREAEERARAVREALIKKAAQESADKWTRD
jgi:hypothetical protein